MPHTRNLPISTHRLRNWLHSQFGELRFERNVEVLSTYFIFHFCQPTVVDFPDVMPWRRRRRSPFSNIEKHSICTRHQPHACVEENDHKTSRSFWFIAFDHTPRDRLTLFRHLISSHRTSIPIRLKFLSRALCSSETTKCSICHDFMCVPRLWHSFSFECSPIEIYIYMVFSS